MVDFLQFSGIIPNIIILSDNLAAVSAAQGVDFIGRRFGIILALVDCMKNTPTSKSQTRAMSLLGLAVGDSYEAAALALENAGYRRDGIPAGQTWRSAAKMTNNDLLAGIVVSEEERNERMFGRERVEY